MMANNEWREDHDVKENLVLLSEDDLGPKPYFLRYFMGLKIDYDLIMVN